MWSYIIIMLNYIDIFQDIVHSFVLGVLYWIVCIEAGIFAGLWGNEVASLSSNSGQSVGGAIGEIVIFLLISVSHGRAHTCFKCYYIKVYNLIN